MMPQPFLFPWNFSIQMSYLTLDYSALLKFQYHLHAIWNEKTGFRFHWHPLSNIGIVGHLHCCLWATTGRTKNYASVFRETLL